MTNPQTYWGIDTLSGESFSSFDTRSAGINGLGVAALSDSNLLDVWIESSSSLIFGVRNVVPETWALATYFTRRSHLALLRYCP